MLLQLPDCARASMQLVPEVVIHPLLGCWFLLNQIDQFQGPVSLVHCLVGESADKSRIRCRRYPSKHLKVVS